MNFPGPFKIEGINSKTLNNLPVGVGTVFMHFTPCLRILPVSGSSVVHGQLPKLVIHRAVEVLAQEERPEPKECVHLGRLSNT